MGIRIDRILSLLRTQSVSRAEEIGKAPLLGLNSNGLI
jgi:hypothetical protein